MRPSLPTRVQSEVEAQDAAKSPFGGDSVPSPPGGLTNRTRFSKCQEPAPPLGSVEAKTSPLWQTSQASDARHVDADQARRC
jgi:hypothetical protein